MTLSVEEKAARYDRLICPKCERMAVRAVAKLCGHADCPLLARADDEILSWRAKHPDKIDRAKQEGPGT